MTDVGDPSELAAALDVFDRVEANLEKLERIWQELAGSYPEGIAFGLDTATVDDLVRSFSLVLEELPPIDGFRIDALPLSPDAVAQARFDANEIGELEAKLAVERGIEEPGRQIAEYRFRINRGRRSLVRGHVGDVTSRIDQLLREVDAADGIGSWRLGDRWSELAGLVAELDRLVGQLVPGRARWSDLRRHLRFAQSNDLSDIVSMDWPSVKAEVEAALYDDREPLPVAVDDLGELVRARPSGPVSTRLPWNRLSDEHFEALIYDLFRRTDGYENVNWLMRTRAADRGRDVEAHRIVIDPLSGTRRYRVIVQCKHWLQRSISAPDLSACIESVRLWEPPTIDVLVIATSGRFTQDAVAVAERRNLAREAPAIELWPDSHLETLLARRPGLAAAHGLR